jgi:glycosyltransferase involved in cell wall biosynthesis
VTPKLSVITPSYNQAAFIERTIRSVLDQGYANLEYIVVDGGSTDGSVGIIERYADYLSWWVSEPDEGQTDALNKGLDHATGKILTYINSDDYFLPGAFEAAVRTFEHSEALWAVGAAQFVDASGRLAEVWRPQLPRGRRQWWILDPWGVPQPSTFWRREVFERFGKFRQDMHYVFDTEFGLRLALAGELPELIDLDLAVRVVHPDAKSWNPKEFRREERRFVRLCAPMLSQRERLALHLARAFKAIGGHWLLRLASKLKRRLIGSGSRYASSTTSE